MPIYEFECLKQGHVFEKLMGFNDPIPNNCPTCNSKVKKLVSQSSFHLKGNGWYVTDYKNNKETKTKTTSIKKEDKKEVKKAA